MPALVFALIVLLVILTIFRIGMRKCRVKCKCPKCLVPAHPRNIHLLASETRETGLNDIEETVSARNHNPFPTQPDHTANLWKCDHSHAKMAEGRGYLDNSFAVDFPTPIRGGKQAHVSECSNTHIMSRFGASAS